MIGVQILVLIMLDYVNVGCLSLVCFVDMISVGLVCLFQIVCKGWIVVGYDVDFIVVDLKCIEIICNDWIVFKVGWMLYDGKEVIGWFVGMIVCGWWIMWDGDLVILLCGEVVVFQDGVKL